MVILLTECQEFFKNSNFRKKIWLKNKLKMYFDDTSEEQKLFEDIQFKRRVQFVDDDNIIDIAVIPSAKRTEK